MQDDADARLRERIRGLLAGGLQTQTAPVPRDNVESDAIVNELHGLDAEQLQEKLTISGFAGAPYGREKQRCHDCMYYLVHRKWCALPGIELPVEPDWWCRLWRV